MLNLHLLNFIQFFFYFFILGLILYYKLSNLMKIFNQTLLTKNATSNNYNMNNNKLNLNLNNGCNS